MKDLLGPPRSLAELDSTLAKSSFAVAASLEFRGGGDSQGSGTISRDGPCQYLARARRRLGWPISRGDAWLRRNMQAFSNQPESRLERISARVRRVPSNDHHRRTGRVFFVGLFLYTVAVDLAQRAMPAVVKLYGPSPSAPSPWPKPTMASIRSTQRSSLLHRRARCGDRVRMDQLAGPGI